MGEEGTGRQPRHFLVLELAPERGAGGQPQEPAADDAGPLQAGAEDGAAGGPAPPRLDAGLLELGVDLGRQRLLELGREGIADFGTRSRWRRWSGVRSSSRRPLETTTR